MEESENRYSRILEQSSESTASHTYSRQRRYMNSIEIEPNASVEDYESLDYDTCINSIKQDEDRGKSLTDIRKINAMRWVISTAIGICTAVVACFIDISIETLSFYKFSWIQYYIDRGIKESTSYIPISLWYTLITIPLFVASFLGSYVEPVAAGSGIPQIKCYLNGVKVPRVVRIKTLFAKMIGVICSVLGGLLVGKEGPMIHSGAVIAAGISQGKSTTFDWDCDIFQYFREDKEKRDFVSAGAAAGVAAAFGAPIGGLLFSLEEGASFWNQRLTWRVFYNAMVTGFTLNLILSAYKGQAGKLAANGLLNLGKFDDLTYELFELPIFFVIATICGMLGALFNYLNCKLTIFRSRYIRTPIRKICETLAVGWLTLFITIVMIYSMPACRDVDKSLDGIQAQVYCPAGQESGIADLWLKTPEGAVRALFHNPNGAYSAQTLMSFGVANFGLSCITYGLGVPSGLFIPALLVGGTVGRLAGVIVSTAYPNTAWADEGKYALVGAAAMLAAVVRMTLSLNVILLECIGNITFGIPLMLILITAKGVGDFFNEGLYDIHIHLMKAPLLGWEPPSLGHRIFSVEVMSRNVVKLNLVEKVGNIYRTLEKCAHNGFPIVQCDNMGQPTEQLRGIILRSQLIVLLMNKVFNENTEVWSSKIKLDIFRSNYPRYKKLVDVNLNADDMDKTIDLSPFMNSAPYVVYASTTLPRIFTLFRALGLRHLIVVDHHNMVVGIITRKDLVQFDGLILNSRRPRISQ